MRIFTLLLIALFTSMSLSAQVFIVESPDDVVGVYTIGTANFGAQLIDSVWCGQVVQTDPLDACTDPTNDLTGKVAMIDRGACEFGLKILGAEMQGAIAAIIVNNQVGAGVINMAPGAVGDQVTIPSCFISFEDGELLKAALATGDMNVCMGNIIFPDNISIGVDDVTGPFTATTPADQIEEDGAGLFQPAVRIANDGSNDASEVTTNYTIDFTPEGGTASTVYDETVSTGLLVSGDSVLHDILPAFDYTGSEKGIYSATYTIASGTVDEFPANNSQSYEFSVTENVFAEGPWDHENNQPARNAAFTILDGGTVEMISSFRVAKGIGYTIDSVRFYSSVSAADFTTMDGIAVEASLYEWDDADGDGGVIADEVTRVAFTESNTFGPESSTGEWVTLPLLDFLSFEIGYTVPDDGKVYFIGTRYTGTESVFFGFNTNYSWGLADALGLLQTDADLPYLQTNTIVSGEADFNTVGLFNDFFGFSATALYVNKIPTSTNNLTDLEAKVTLFPNPASTSLTATITLEEQTSRLVYSVTDMQGRQILVEEKSNLKEDMIEIDVMALPTGIYNLNITTDKGIKTERFNVVH